MTTTLFDGGTVVTGADGSRLDWALVEGPRVVATGRRDDIPEADRRVELDGATLLPAFCDAHVHLPATGLYEGGLDLRGERRSSAILAALGERAHSGTGPLFAGNFEDPLDEALDAQALDRAVGEKAAMLARADMHSCFVSTALLETLDLNALDGVDRDEDGRPTGYLREMAAAAAWSWFERALPPEEQADAIRRAARRAYSKGVATVHEMYVVEWRGWSSLGTVQATLEELPLNVVLYVATPEVERVIDLGLERVGGDFFLDGSFGSYTAWLSRPYVGSPPPGSSPAGTRYRSDEELEDFFFSAQRARLQVGVHAIGDAAIDQALRTWARVAAEVGADEVKQLRHRIEHFECASDDHIARARSLGLVASVQPAFDRLWGGHNGMYARRIGEDRALEMNRFRSMLRAGLTLGAGSDSTVTPLDPFLALSSLRAHQVADESVSADEALRAHTVGAHALARQEDERGTIETGKSADLVALDRDPLAISPDELLEVGVLGTWIAGRRVWPEMEEAA